MNYTIKLILLLLISVFTNKNIKLTNRFKKRESTLLIAANNIHKALMQIENKKSSESKAHVEGNKDWVKLNNQFKLTIKNKEKNLLNYLLSLQKNFDLIYIKPYKKEIAEINKKINLNNKNLSTNVKRKKQYQYASKDLQIKYNNTNYTTRELREIIKNNIDTYNNIKSNLILKKNIFKEKFNQISSHFNNFIVIKKVLYNYDSSLKLFYHDKIYKQEFKAVQFKRSFQLRSLNQIALSTLKNSYQGIISASITFKEQNKILRKNYLWWADFGMSILFRGLFISLVLATIFVKEIKNISYLTSLIGKGDLDVQFPVKRSDELGVLGLQLNNMVAGLKERQNLIGELKAAGEIQKRLIPSNFPNAFPNIKFSGFYKPMQGVGGDYYDVIPLSEENSHKFYILIADVSNHGVGPALIMTQMRSYIQALANFGKSSKELLLDLNKNIYAETPDDIFITMFIGLFDTSTNIMEYTMAGHNESIVRKNDNEIIIMPKGGMPLGVLENEDYSGMLKSKTFQMQPGDMFFQYTDGLTEAMNNDGEMYGLERLEQFLKNNTLKFDLLLKSLARDIEDFTTKNLLDGDFSELNDDFALIAFELDNESINSTPAEETSIG